MENALRGYDVSQNFPSQIIYLSVYFILYCFVLVNIWLIFFYSCLVIVDTYLILPVQITIVLVINIFYNHLN